MLVAVCGPPRSGKSCFLAGLTKNLPRDSYYLFRACPDGEGSWTYRSPAAARHRRKGRFCPELVSWYVAALRRAATMAPLVLVDLGGIPSQENARIMREGDISAAIILCGDPDQIPIWQEFATACGVSVLATIHSQYDAAADDPAATPMVVHHLERGEDVSARPTTQRVAEMLLSQIRPKEVSNMLQDGVLTISALAAALGKEPVKRTLPNGREVTQIVWEASDLPAISHLLHNRSGDLPEVVDIDGPAPAWLVAALAHECHPRHVRLNSPDGFVPVGCPRPAGEGTGDNLEFRVTTRPDGWTMVLCQQRDPSVPLNPADLTNVAPPALGMGARVVLSGRMPNWLAASLAMAYHGTAAAVALYQPGTGATVAWSHSAAVPLGTAITE